MAGQAALIADTIAGMRRALTREQDDSDSDVFDEPTKPTNRGNKLKRTAEHFHEGELGGRRPYKKRIEHASYERYIVRRNPRRYDELGYELDPEEEDERADMEAAERNPYSGVKVQNLLMPLTAASDLPTHPAISHTYASQVLPEMVQQAFDMLRKERKFLWEVKKLATSLRGDHNSVPCNMFDDEREDELFPLGPILNGLLDDDNGLGISKVSTQDSHNGHDGGGLTSVNVVKVVVEDTSADSNNVHEEVDRAVDTLVIARQTEGIGKNSVPMAGFIAAKKGKIATLGDDTQHGTELGEAGKPVATNGVMPEDDHHEDSAQADGEDDEMSGDEPMPRMVTRGAAAAASAPPYTKVPSTRSPSPRASLPPIHPLFVPPIASIPNRDMYLPPAEAEEARRIITMWVQKQEEVVRGAERLYEGLLKAERMRHTVFYWCRAEDHVGEMSDGEEWVDEEEWGLDGPLRKGMVEDGGNGAGAEEEHGGKKRKTKGVQ